MIGFLVKFLSVTNHVMTFTIFNRKEWVVVSLTSSTDAPTTLMMLITLLPYVASTTRMLMRTYTARMNYG